jgi:hypothetical protein
LDSSTFTVVNSGSPADIAVDILGYHLCELAPQPVLQVERKCGCFGADGVATLTFTRDVWYVVSQYEAMDGKLASAPINYSGSNGKTATFNGTPGRTFCGYSFVQQ